MEVIVFLKTRSSNLNNLVFTEVVLLVTMYINLGSLLNEVQQ